jgi:hypothetical protein
VRRKIEMTTIKEEFFGIECRKIGILQVEANIQWKDIIHREPTRLSCITAWCSAVKLHLPLCRPLSLLKSMSFAGRDNAVILHILY